MVLKILELNTESFVSPVLYLLKLCACITLKRIKMVRN